MPDLTCQHCRETYTVPQHRVEISKFCSVRCRADWRTANWVGENNPRWTGGVRTKDCAHCGKSFSLKPPQPITTFKTRRFCSKPCADEGGIRHTGEANSRWTGGKRNRSSKQAAWARKVISRDKATCQHCEATGVELHAHHVLSFKDNPDLQWDIANGLTLCAPCHWTVHSAPTENGVNSGNPHRPEADGNPEPSQGRKVLEGATTRGRAYRRIQSECAFCHAFISRRASDMLGKARHFCDYTCAGKWRSQEAVARRAHGGNASTSAPPERDDIV